MSHQLLFAGGGIGGLTSAVLSHQAGIDCRVLEQAKRYEEKGSGISLMSNAILALREFGLDQAFMDIGEAMTDFQVRDPKDRLIFSSDFAKITKHVGAPSLCLHRGDLQKLLLELAKKIPIDLDSRVCDYQVGPAGVLTTAEVGGSIQKYQSQLLVGCDGLKSKVRELLEQKNPSLAIPSTPLRSSGFTAWLGTIPFQASSFKPGMVIHYWGEGMRVGLIDIGKGRLYWWVTMNHSLVQKGPILEFLRERFKNWPPLVRAALEQTPDSYDIIQVETLDRKPRDFWGIGPVTLLGDAAHPSLTSLGQGAGLAIEDAVVLTKNLSAQCSAEGLRVFESLRRRRTSQVVNLSRTVATYEQWENKLAVGLRNTAFRLMPQAMIDAQNKSLLHFPKIKESP